MSLYRSISRSNKKVRHTLQSSLFSYHKIIIMEIQYAFQIMKVDDSLDNICTRIASPKVVRCTVEPNGEKQDIDVPGAPQKSKVVTLSVDAMSHFSERSECARNRSFSPIARRLEFEKTPPTPPASEYDHEEEEEDNDDYMSDTETVSAAGDKFEYDSNGQLRGYWFCGEFVPHITDEELFNNVLQEMHYRDAAHAVEHGIVHRVLLEHVAVQAR